MMLLFLGQFKLANVYSQTNESQNSNGLKSIVGVESGKRSVGLSFPIFAKTWLQTAKYMLKQVSDHRVLIGERSFSLPYVITTGDFEHYKLLAKDDATVLQV